MSTYDRRSTRLSWFLKGLAILLDRWPLVLLVLFFAMPQGPHLLLQWDFYGPRDNPYRVENCLYIGSRGLVRPGFYGHEACPIVAWIDTREMNR